MNIECPLRRMNARRHPPPIPNIAWFYCYQLQINRFLSFASQQPTVQTSTTCSVMHQRRSSVVLNSRRFVRRRRSVFQPQVSVGSAATAAEEEEELFDATSWTLTTCSDYGRTSCTCNCVQLVSGRILSRRCRTPAARYGVELRRRRTGTARSSCATRP